MSDFVKALPIAEGDRIARVIADDDFHYFSTNQHEISYLLCVELYGKINDISGEDLTMFARNNLKAQINDEQNAMVRVSGDPVAYFISVL